MHWLSTFVEQLFAAWQEKFVLASVLAVSIQLLEQFSTTFDADSFLIVLLLSLVLIDCFLAIVNSIKRRTFTFGLAARAALKLPLFCLYLFLVGAIGISIEHSVKVGLPILNIFVAYLIATEAFVIIRYLYVLGVKIPPLLLFLLRSFKDRIEAVLKGSIGDRLGNAQKSEEMQQIMKEDEESGSKE